jgi:ABC-type lipoprotein release transport system permease subunit
MNDYEDMIASGLLGTLLGTLIGAMITLALLDVPLFNSLWWLG